MARVERRFHVKVPSDLTRTRLVPERYRVSLGNRNRGVSFAGHPRHLEKRLGRRRMVGVAEVTEQVQTEADVDRINDDAVLFAVNAVLDACERIAAEG